MLSNFQHGGNASLQFCLLGQPQFRETLAHPDLEQFRQRTVASYHLVGLDQRESALYIEHRLASVGWKEDPFLTPECLREIFDQTMGIPRKINYLCSRLFLLGELEELHKLDKDHVVTVGEDVAEEVAAVAEVQGDTSLREGAVEGKSSSVTSLPARKLDAANFRVVSGDVTSELAHLRRRVESLEQQAGQDSEKIVGLVIDQLKLLIDSLARLKS